MFNSLRKFLNKWKYNQGIYEERTGIEDLKKAQFYLNDLIEWMESD
ncbi:hypothetical protein ARD00_01541 [Listeria monocytogenes]|nr:hypothetical protein ARD00_01541 [Listeria monocytogenes]